MSRRAKTLIAAVLIVFFWLPFYALLITGLARHLLPHAAWYVALAFYALGGTLWIVPIGLALPWMYREKEARQ
jgi:hypothetical protein